MKIMPLIGIVFLVMILTNFSVGVIPAAILLNIAWRMAFSRRWRNNLEVIATNFISEKLTGRTANIPKRPKKKKEIKIENLGDLTMESVKELIHECTLTVEKIEVLNLDVPRDDVHDRIRGICNLAYTIINDFRDNPQHIKYAKKFIKYYLDTTLKIVKKYVQLSSHQFKDAQISDLLTKIESSLDKIHLTFEKQLAKLFENDVLDIDAEISVLDQTISMEDF